MPSATPPVGLLNAAIRGLFGLAAFGLVIFSAIVPRGSLGSHGQAAAGEQWVEIARATFSGVPDGPGDGKGFPAELGKVSTIARDAPNAAAASSGRLVLSNSGSTSGGESGVELTPVVEAGSGAIVSFTFETNCNALDVSISSCADTDCSPGGVDDGTTTELISVEVDDDQLLVNGRVLKMRIDKGVAYRFDLGVYDADGKAGLYDLLLTNLETGESEHWSDALVGSYLPVDSIRFTRSASDSGDVYLDDLSILAPSK